MISKVKKQLLIDWEPIGLRTKAKENQTLLSVAQNAGIKLVAFCGGTGTCGACKIILADGELSSVTSVELEHLSEDELAAGYRLACQSIPLTDLKINIPPESMSSVQRLQLEGVQKDYPVDSRLFGVDVKIPEPTIHDVRADSIRIHDSLREVGQPFKLFHTNLLKTFSDEVRTLGWNVKAILDRTTDRLIGFLPYDAKMYGLAFDIGTTKVAVYLLDLESGTCVAKKGAMNPQIIYGEDVVNRIAYAVAEPNGRNVLQKVLVDTINDLVNDVTSEVGCKADQIMEAVVVCNTAIHHFFLNLPVKQLGLYPFVPCVSEAIYIGTGFLGMKIAQGASVYLPENIAGYVGADHVSMLIGTDSQLTRKNRIALDIGTNTEITFINDDGRMFCCSCASGPAFEGAHIHNGMRASSGAIERVQIRDRKLHYQTIGDKPAVGICGSGILDLVSELKRSGAINDRGNFDPTFPGVEKAPQNYKYVLVPAEESVTGNDISMVRKDINEIILAKSAIRTGIEILLIEAGKTYEDIDEFVVAGAFGTYLDLKAAIEIGMFPDIPESRFVQVGNAAGTGAQMMLLSDKKRAECKVMTERMEYVELTTHPKFKEILINSMNLRKNLPRK